MDDYIKRKDAEMSHCSECSWNGCSLCPCEDVKAILAIPAADVVERRTGKWLHEQLLPDNVYGHMVAECSACHEVRIVDNYCPNCGARMEVDNA